MLTYGAPPGAVNAPAFTWDGSLMCSVDEFEDIEGGHKRFNRSWLTSKNPMTAPEKTIMEGDEALFSQGILEEIWNMLVNVWGWKRLLLFNLSCELLLIFGFAIILIAIVK